MLERRLNLHLQHAVLGLLLALCFGESLTTASPPPTPSAHSGLTDATPTVALSPPMHRLLSKTQTGNVVAASPMRLVPPLIEASFVAASPKDWGMPVLPSPSSKVDGAVKIAVKRDSQSPLLLPLLQGDPAVAAATRLPESESTEAAANSGVWWSTAGLNASDVGEVATGNRSVERFAVLKLDFQKVATPFFISFWILIASAAKMGFHLSRKLSSVLPESSLLIVLGIIVGIMFFYSTESRSYHMMDADTFFYFLLPPIILESGYFMPNRAFFDNIGTILLYAIVGTLFNTFTIGLSLWGLSLAGAMGNGCTIQLLHCLLFSSLVSAVDPVAVLAVFEEIQVNQMLHIIVFGESLLNDAVTVVLHHIFEAYSYMGSENIQPIDVVAGVAAFCVVGIGGTITGILFGFLGAFVTKYTSHVRVIEPICIFLIAYLSYLSAESFHFSGIVALTFCGMIMKRYAEPNISEKSQTTVKYFMKMLSSVSETIIFLFLGTSTVMDSHAGNAVFIIMTVVFCLLYRAIGVVFLTAIVNRYRMLKLSYVDQFVMSYSGLRGAVAFALAITLDANVIASKNLFVTTTVAVILFTVFVQGTTVKPLVNVLRVQRQDKGKRTMNKQLNERMIHHIMGGIEEISGIHGNHWLRHRFEYYDGKYFKRYLLRERPCTRETGILRVSSKLCQRDAMEQAQKPLVLNRVPGIGGSMNDLVYKPTHFRLNRNLSEVEILRSPTLEELEALAKLTASGTVIDVNALETTNNKKMADDCKTHHMSPDHAAYSRKKWSKKRKYLSDVNVEQSELHSPASRHHHAFRFHLRHQSGRQPLRKQPYSDVAAESSLDTVNITGSRDLPNDGTIYRKNVTFSEVQADAKSSPSMRRLHDEALQSSLPYRPGRSNSTNSKLLGSGVDVSGSATGGKTRPQICDATFGGASPPVDESPVSDAPALVSSLGSVGDFLPWRQAVDFAPEVSHRAQFNAPALALVVGKPSDGVSSSETPIVERSSPATMPPRFELYLAEGDEDVARKASGSRSLPASVSLARPRLTEPAAGTLQRSSSRTAPKVTAVTDRLSPSVGTTPLSGERQGSAYERNEAHHSEHSCSSRSSSSNDEIGTDAADERLADEDESKKAGDETPLPSQKRHRDKNSNERPNCRPSRRQASCDSGDAASSLLGNSSQPE